MTAAIRFVLCGALMYLTAAGIFAQTSTATETKKFQVIAVDGDELVVRLPEGTRKLTVPPDFRFTVDGKSLSVQELKPGMAGTATITTKTTAIPVTVTEVKSGRVRRAMGTSIIVETGGELKMFTQSDIDKRGVKIMRDGRLAQISDFRENDQLTATIITTMPPRIVTEKEVQATLAKSAAPAGSASAATSTSSSTPRPAAAPPGSAATSGAAPRQLPTTAGPLPVLGIGGLASLLVGVGFTVRRRAAKS
jgi:hypothetical protein